MTVLEFFALYAEFAVVRPSWSRERYAFRYFLDCLGSCALEGITARHVDSWRSARRLAVADQSVDREFNAVCSMFRKAVEWGYIEVSPCDRLHRLGGSNPRFRTLSKEEIEVVMASALRAGPVVYWIVRTLHDTGMRPSELRSLLWSQVDFTECVFSLSRTKTGRGRKIYCSPAVVAATAALPRFEPRVCPTWPIRSLVSVCRSIRNFHLYDLRKNFITRALEQGADVSIVARAAGCSAQTILKFYASPPDHALRACFLRASLYERSGVQLKLIHDG